jgi:hypothetical protein
VSGDKSQRRGDGAAARKIAEERAQLRFAIASPRMATVLYHHPYSRAANAVWMLEEVGVPYELRHVDMLAAEHKRPEILA